MHRTLKDETTKPSANSLPAQQKKFDRFRLEFNHERPHEALSNETPGSLYLPSARMFPNVLPEYAYPRGFLTRKVNNSGDMSWKHGRVFVSEVFRGEEIGLEQMEEGIYRIFFCDLEVGNFDSFDLRFRPRLRTI